MSTISSLIPATKTSAVETALLETFGKIEVDTISLLVGGLSGSGVYKIVVDSKPYLLKLPEPQVGMVAPPPIYYQLAAKSGIAPCFYYHDKNTGVSISDFIEHSPIFTLPPEKIIREMAAIIKAIHDVEVDGTATDLLQLVDNMVQWLQESGLFTKDVWQEFLSYYEIIRERYPWNDSDKVLSHNDLNPSNTLWDGKKVWIIDWDVASVNDRYVDLSITANFFVHRPEDEQLFLEIYFDEEVSAVQKARFFIMRQVCRIVYTKEMLQRAVAGKPAEVLNFIGAEVINLKEVGTRMRTGKLSLQTCEGQYQYGMALFHEALEQMRSEKLADSIASLSVR